jgi:hypothetical protein
LSKFTSKQLLKLFDLGFIPGPQESRRNFFDRVRKTRTYLSSLPPEKQSTFPFKHPTEIKKLPIWIGGCTHIFEHDGVRMGTIELNKRIHLPELIEHECVHYRRLMFDEPEYEEILAFDTSNTWRQNWGALLDQGSKKLLFFSYLISLIGCLTGYGALVLLPLAHLGFNMRKLKKKQQHYTDLKQTLPPYLHKCLLGFTDKEFLTLHPYPLEKLISVFKKGDSIRHKMLYAFLNTIKS